MSQPGLDLEHYKKLLSQQKEMVLKALRDRKKPAGEERTSLRESTAEISFTDNHPSDTAAEAFERSKDDFMEEKHLKLLGEIEDALKRIDSGNYGMCLKCGKPIEQERLEAIPYTRYCLHCKEQLEKEAKNFRDDRHPGEKFNLYPPPEDDTGISGDEIWEILSRYGTADTPQDLPEEKMDLPGEEE